jgi:cytochrome P450 family 4
LEQFVEVMEKHGEILVEKLRKLEGQEVDIFPLISLYAIDVICESAMGYDLNAQSDTECDYVISVKE